MTDLNPNILALLNKRGYKSEDEIEEFLSFKPKRTHDPFLLPDMEEGVDLVLSAIEQGKRICIYGDYDADGVTSTTILLEVLSHLTDNLSYYIPSRFDEGYGLNMDAMDKIRNADVGLVITVDCGSTSVDEVAHGKALGMDILITDHHKVGDNMPNCPLINPGRKDSAYPFNFLAGCGVAFKLSQALCLTAGLESSVYNNVLDLVAIGTIGDVVPLIDENRTLVKYGLMLVNEGRRKALVKLIDGIGLKLGNVQSENVGFVIAPHINAAGRVKDAKLGVKLFRAEDEDNVDSLVELIKECNEERRKFQQQVYKQCIEIINSKPLENFIFIELEDAHEGVAGIAAGRIKELFHRPVAIVTPTENDCVKGTARSIEGIDLYEFLAEFQPLFTRFGGHKAACGFTLEKKRLEALKLGIEKSILNMTSSNGDLLTRQWNPEIYITVEELDMKLMQQLNLLEPFGNMNRKPLVKTEGILSGMSAMGGENQYRRFFIEKNSIKISSVCFALKDGKMEQLVEGRTYEFLGYPSVNQWNGKETVQFQVEKVFSIDAE